MHRAEPDLTITLCSRLKVRVLRTERLETLLPYGWVTLSPTTAGYDSLREVHHRMLLLDASTGGNGSANIIISHPTLHHADALVKARNARRASLRRRWWHVCGRKPHVEECGVSGDGLRFLAHTGFDGRPRRRFEGVRPRVLSVVSGGTQCRQKVSMAES